MINLLGDLWAKGEPLWDLALKNPKVQLHLYDKGAARKGRKMGHFNLLNPNLKKGCEEAEALFLELKT